MYPNSPHVDEPTMTDLRGILPGQRPPIDATVLDEPTSEVPIIRPAGVPEPEPESEPAGAEPAISEPATDAGPESPVASVTEEAAADEEALELEEALEDEGEPEPAEAAVYEEAPVAPLATPPVLPAFGTDPLPEPPPTNSEMAKMSWAPAPAAPPGLVPAPSAGIFEPTPPPPVTEFEPERELEPVESALPAVVETTEPEPVEDLGEVAELAPPAPLVEITESAPFEEESEPVAIVVEPEPAAPEPGRAPGEVAEPAIALWSDEAAEQVRDQWRDLQVQFVDDPTAAVNGAKSLVTEAVQELADTLLAAQDALDPFRGTERVDTETMRVAMRSYREFLDRVLAL
jgi:hypothetical protein